jgi:hypothetical protein
MDRKKIMLSLVLAKQGVKVLQVEDQIWQVSFIDYDLRCFRKLPCQVDNLKLEISLTNFLGMNSIGATSPRDSCGLS